MHSLWFGNTRITFPRPQETVVIEKSGFLRSIDRSLYRLTGLANTKGIQILHGQSFRRKSATRDSLGSTMMSESCLIGVNNALKFTDKNEINKMFIAVNTTAPRAAESGHLCRLRSEETEFCVVLNAILVDDCVTLGLILRRNSCLVSLQKVSKMSAVELSYERNNLACCKLK